MRIVFKLSQAKTRDLKQLKQFDICLLGTRLMQPNVPMAVEIPQGWWYPKTWQGLQRLGVHITRDTIPPQPNDIVTEGTHIPIARLDRQYKPLTPQSILKPPLIHVTFEEAVQWLELQRQTNPAIWLPISPDNPLYWNSPQQTSQQPLPHWLEWAYWRKAQPPIDPGTRTFSGFRRELKIHPPSRSM